MSKDNGSINENVVRQLAEILNETDLTEIEYEKDDCRVARQINVIQGAPHVAAVAAAPVMAPTPASDAPLSVPAALDISKHPGAIKSPMVGNVYLSPAPGTDAFVTVGDSVKAGDSILIIEAMKVMNQIKAPKDGTVKEILVQDTDPVEFDQVLVIIE